MMDIMLQHFWLLCGLWCGVGNAIYFRIRLRKSIVNQDITAKEADRFSIGILLALLIPSMIFWVLQITSGPQATPHFETWQPFQNNIGITVTIFCWTLLFLWAWFLKGAESYSKYANLISTGPKFMNHPAVFKGFTLVIILVGIFSIKGKFL